MRLWACCDCAQGGDEEWRVQHLVVHDHRYFMSAYKAPRQTDRSINVYDALPPLEESR